MGNIFYPLLFGNLGSLMQRFDGNNEAEIAKKSKWGLLWLNFIKFYNLLLKFFKEQFEFLESSEIESRDSIKLVARASSRTFPLLFQISCSVQIARRCRLVVRRLDFRLCFASVQTVPKIKFKCDIKTKWKVKKLSALAFVNRSWVVFAVEKSQQCRTPPRKAGSFEGRRSFSSA